MFYVFQSFFSGCNRTVFDTKYGFDKALVMGDDAAIILDVKEWKDYSGEQLQINFNDNSGILTSFVNTDFKWFFGER